MRRGIAVVVLVLSAAALAATVAHADGGTTTGTTTTTAGAPPAPLAHTTLPAGCVGAGSFAITLPDHSPVAIGMPAATAAASEYSSTKGQLVAFDTAKVKKGSTCSGTRLTLSGVSLFGGVVTASSVRSMDGRGAVTGVTVDGTSVTLRAGHGNAVRGWGRLALGVTRGRLTAPLGLLLVKRHFGLPRGTTLLVAFAAAPRPVTKTAQQPAMTTTSTEASATGAKKARPHKKQNKVPQPLKVTPRLGFKSGHYVFPVDGGASYVDTYGANRSDIYDGWHHGDDLFAPLGTPILAVRKGTLSLVGWNQLGGWRLWLTDAKGNSFYYAHLAGYSKWILTHRHVRAGQVIGFLGRTGDAFTTTPHLHFEIHPHQLLSLGYDGAVDPTTYLRKWQVVKVPQALIPRPARLRAPVGTPQEEAAVVWHELLAARHLLPAKAATPILTTAHPAMFRTSFPRTGSVAGQRPRRLAGFKTTAARVVSQPANGAEPWTVAAFVFSLLVLSWITSRAALARWRHRNSSG